MKDEPQSEKNAALHRDLLLTVADTLREMRQRWPTMTLAEAEMELRRSAGGQARQAVQV